jgi:hypothetical protein
MIDGVNLLHMLRALKNSSEIYKNMPFLGFCWILMKKSISKTLTFFSEHSFQSEKLI